MRSRTLISLGALLLLGALTACLPADPGPGGLYRAPQASITPVVQARGAPTVWGSAPPIDEAYGATLYAGTSIEQPDPRPALVDGREPLRLWVASPDDGRTDRPVILWVHGGGFAVGIDSMYGLAAGTGRDYAARGYVSISVEYRIDTTLVGNGTPTSRPPSLCQWVQDHVNPDDPVWTARREQCQRNVLAAQNDVQGAVRWVKAHAADLGIDPNKVAIGGFSAGAVTAANVGYRTDTVADLGTETYFSGDVRSVSQSKVKATFGASGCVYSSDLGGPTAIGTDDAPASYIHSRFDQAVPYSCAAAAFGEARTQGLVAELTSYCTENGHANNLYDAHRDATDLQWTTFLTRQLSLYSGTREPSAEPFCS